MNWTPEQKPLVEKYSRAYTWLVINEKDPKQKDNYEKVNQKLMELEDQLRETGVTNDQLGEILAQVKKLTDKKTGEMSGRELEFVCQVIFGKDTKLDNRPLKLSDMVFANGKLATYAYHKREGNMD